MDTSTPYNRAASIVQERERIRFYQTNEPTAADPKRVLVAGDWASCRCYADAAERPASSLYGDYAQTIQDADLAIVNFECGLAGDGPVRKEGPNLEGTPESIRALREHGFRLATLANNHTVDFGRSGLDALLERCDEAGMDVVGAGGDPYRPVYYDLGDTRVGILNFVEPMEAPVPTHTGSELANAFDIRVIHDITRTRAECDVLLVIVHGAREYVPLPSYYWYSYALRLADAGADVVIGHHPHVPQGGTLRVTPDGRTVPVLYSTGNFIFRPAMPVPEQIPPHTGDGYLVELGIAKKRIEAVHLLPYGIHGGEGIRPVPTEDLDRFCHFIRELSRDLQDPSRVEAWFDAVVDYQWEKHYAGRFQRFTEQFFAGDIEALRWVRSHHRSPTHYELVDRALMRMQHGLFGTSDPELRERLSSWYEGTWPCAGFGTPIADQ